MEKIKELEKELEYIKSVIADLKPYDGEASFYYWQRDEIERELEELRSDKSEKQD